MQDNSSQFFYELTPDRILNAVEELGIRCTGRVTGLNSVENRVFDVEIEVPEEEIKSRYDTSRVIKFYRPGRWSREQIQEEHDFIADLEERDIPVVSPLKLANGKTYSNIPGLENDLFYSVFPKVGGRILDEYSDDQIRLLGRLIARMHQAARMKPVKHRINLNPQTFGIDNCNYLVKNNFLPPEIEGRYVQLVNQICETCAPWFETVTNHRLHGDCHLGNILWLDDTCKFIDFDDFVSGPPIQDLWLIVPGRDEWNIKQRELLIESYSEFTEFDHESVRLIEPLRALRLIHFSAWIAKRWEDPAFKNLFSIFGSQQYWREELNALEEILQIMVCGEVY